MTERPPVWPAYALVGAALLATVSLQLISTGVVRTSEAVGLLAAAAIVVLLIARRDKLARSRVSGVTERPPRWRAYAEAGAVLLAIASLQLISTGVIRTSEAVGLLAAGAILVSVIARRDKLARAQVSGVTEHAPIEHPPIWTVYVLVGAALLAIASFTLISIGVVGTGKFLGLLAAVAMASAVVPHPTVMLLWRWPVAYAAVCITVAYLLWNSVRQ